MATMIAPRGDSMTAFSNSLELDDVHTPARYFALLFSLSTGVLGIVLNSNRHVELSIIVHFLSSLYPRLQVLLNDRSYYSTFRKFYPRKHGYVRIIRVSTCQVSGLNPRAPPWRRNADSLLGNPSQLDSQEIQSRLRSYQR